MKVLTLALLAVTLVLSACGDDDSDAAAQTTTTVMTESAITEPPATTATETPTTTTTAATTTTTAATTTTISALPLLPVPPLGTAFDVGEVAEPGTYATPIGWDGVGGFETIPIEITLTDPMTTRPYGLSDCCGTFDVWGRAFWPEPLPTWVEPHMGWDEEEDRIAFVAPLVVVYRLTHFYPSGDAEDGKMAVADVDDLAAFLADHPALADATEPTAVTIGGHQGVRVESAFTGTLGECGSLEDEAGSFYCVIGLDWEGSPEADWRFRTDIIPVGDQTLLVQTRLYPDAEDQSKAIADTMINTIKFSAT